MTKNEYKWIEIDKLKPYERNPRINDQAVDQVAKSIEEFGFRSPIITDENLRVCVGHTRLKAAKKVGLTKVPVLITHFKDENQFKAYNNVKCKLMNTKYYNVPQSRERLIFIGVRKDLNKDLIYPKPNKKIITVKEVISFLEETEKRNRKKVSKGLYNYAIKLKEGESANKYHPKGSLFGLIRLHPNKPCPTIIKSAGTGLLHYKYYTYFLSIKELQLLQSFNKEFKFFNSRALAIDRIGNSVPPKMMQAIAETIKKEILYK
jgi:site-specific DNA-cytosine methylase